jgi:membrane protease YdiL (CAAX protease family)
MNRRLALIALAAIPVLAALFYLLTRALTPLWGYALGLCLYWVFLATLLLVSTTSTDRAQLLTAQPAGRLITLLCILPVLGLGLFTMDALGALPPIMLVGIAVCAVLNGFLEELFWRGALVPDPTPGIAALAVGLFTGWHLALLTAHGITLTGGAFGLLMGAAALGTIWMAARLYSGTVGLSALSHAGVNLFAFIQLAADNLPPGLAPQIL